MKHAIAAIVLLFACGTAGAAGTGNIGQLADAVRHNNPDLHLGGLYNTQFGGRFHNIHVAAIGLPCSNCHVGPAFAHDYLYVRKTELPPGAPGMVDRSSCLGCHKEGGVADAWYGNATSETGQWHRRAAHERG